MKVLRRLDPVDVLILKRLDRLARSTRQVLKLLDLVTARTKWGFRAPKDTCADTKEWSGSQIHPAIERGVARNETRPHASGRHRTTALEYGQSPALWSANASRSPL